MAELTARRSFLDAEWRHLVMLNYEVAPALLEPLVPAGTTLDFWDGRALASIVGFRFLRTRLLGIPVPFHRNFDEVNLRFYVRRVTAAGEIRRGVTFVRELVPRAAIAIVARLVYNEPYRSLPMRSNAPSTPTEAPGRLNYEWRTSSRWEGVAATAVGSPSVPLAESEAAFVAEHYWGYTRQRDGRTIEYSVIHPQWRVWKAENPTFTADVAALYGKEFVPVLTSPPRSAFVAEGSPVVVFPPESMTARSAS